MKKKEEDILNKVLTFFMKFEQTFTTSDKKTCKENLSQFFAIQDEIKLYVQEPYSKYEDKKPEEWWDYGKKLINKSCFFGGNQGMWPLD